MAPGSDVLELLLPSASASELESARRLTTFFRLLADDALGVGGERVGVDAASAAREMDREGRARALSAIEDLLRSHLHAALSVDDWAWFGEPRVDHQRAWSRLEGLRRERPPVALVPAPGETPLAVAARLLECAAAFGCEALRLAAWRARKASVAGEEGAEEGLLELRRRAAQGGLELLSAELAVDCAAAALDRGDPRTALRRLTEDVPAATPETTPETTPGTPETPGTPSTQRALALVRWCRLLLGQEPGSERVVGGGPLPRCLEELRQDWPAALAALAGPSASPRTPWSEAREPCAPGSRRELGASALLWLRFDGAVRQVHSDLAPGLAADQHAWLRARDGAWTVQGEPEQRLLLTGQPVVLRRLPGEAPLRGTLEPAHRSQTLALVLVPVHDPAGELAGWLHLEFEHLLVPCQERLVALGRALAGPLLSRSPAAEPCVSTTASVAHVEHVEVDEHGEHDPVAQAFRDLVGSLGTKLRHRRWWGFVPAAGRAVCVAEGGEGLAHSSEGPAQAARAGGGRALFRALAAGGVVRFDEPDSRLCLHGQAGSGLVLPALLRGRVTALLALESERRRDFRERDVERLAREVAGRGLEFRLALLRRWHTACHGHDLCLPRCGPGFTAFAERLVAAGRTATPVVLSGESGSGRRTLARWLHFESAGDAPPGPLVSYAAGDERPAGESTSLLVTGLERLGAGEQGELLAWLAQTRPRRLRQSGPRRSGSRGSGPRLLVTLTGSLAAAVESGSLDPELARILGRVEFRVPALADRREELPARVLGLLTRFATEEGLEPPLLDDTALALLWRQAWPGNLGELENAVYKLVLARPAEELGALEVEGVLGAFGVELRRRLPSRHPRRVDLLAALASTRRESGRLNKTRAALYLGWDPDTLVSRMGEQGVDEASLDEPRGWSPA